MRDYLFSFQGRASRAQFWTVSLLLTVLYFALVMVLTKLKQSSGSAALLLISLALLVIIIWIGFANHAKRFHDLDKSGWLSLLILLPIVGWLVSLFWTGFGNGSPSDNRFGPAKPDISTKRLVLYVGGAFLLCVLASCVVGVQNENRQHSASTAQPVVSPVHDPAP